MLDATTETGRGILDRLANGATVVEETRRAFAPGGALALAGYATRDPQVRMAMAVARRVDGQDGWLGVEASTGTGKSLAYLIPGVLGVARASIHEPSESRPVLVSTSSITLQGQLVRKDTPAVGAILGLGITVAARKGISNFACRQRIDEYRMGIFSAAGMDRIARLAAGNWSGDKDDLDFDPGRTWGDASVSSDECSGDKCKFHKDGTCFAVVARKVASTAHVQVVNHHWLAAAGGIHGARPVLLAIDEAHELEDSVRGANSERLTRGSLRDALRVAARVCPGEVADAGRAAVASVVDRADGLARDGRAVQLHAGWSGVVCEQAEATLAKVANALRMFGQGATDEDDRTKATVAAKAVDKVRGRIARVGSCDGGLVLVERDNRYTSVRLVCADVSADVESLRKSHPAGVATSATLAVDGSLDHLAGIGLRAVESLVLPSPFPLERQGLCVVPTIPPCKSPAWESEAVRAAAAAVEAAGGRSLVLCSSWRMMGKIADYIQAQMPAYRVRRQGDAGRAELSAWFRDDVTGVLVATRSFATGLDVAGESLSCVVIDRVPFASPDDPIEAEVGKLAAERTGKSAFAAWSLPQAAMALAQAAGRLIRTPTDRGVLVVLDGRVSDTGMGHVLRAALPPFPRSTQLSDIAPFLAGQAVVAATPGELPRVAFGLTSPDEGTGGSVTRRKRVSP